MKAKRKKEKARRKTFGIEAYPPRNTIAQRGGRLDSMASAVHVTDAIVERRATTNSKLLPDERRSARLDVKIWVRACRTPAGRTACSCKKSAKLRAKLVEKTVGI